MEAAAGVESDPFTGGQSGALIASTILFHWLSALCAQTSCM